MNDRNRSQSRRSPAGPPRSPANRAPRRTGGPSPDELLQIADELEEHARALLGQVRQLQRLAGQLTGGDEARPPRSGSAGRPRSSYPDTSRTRSGASEGGRGRPRRPDSDEREGGVEERGGSTGAPRGRARRPDSEERAPRGGTRSGRTPSWAPQGKRPRS